EKNSYEVIDKESFNKSSLATEFIKDKSTNNKITEKELNIITKVVNNIAPENNNNNNKNNKNNNKNNKNITEFTSTEFEIIIETSKRLSIYTKNSQLADIVNSNIKIVANPITIAGNYVRENLETMLLEVGVINNYQEFRELIVNTYTEIAILEMKESASEEDKLMIQAINSLDEIDESVSKLVERIREWYAIYFPEMDILKNNEAYINSVSDIGNRDLLIEKGFVSYGIEINKSHGADITEEDLEILMEFGKSIQNLQQSRKSIEKYIEIKMDKIAPNLKNIAGPSLGAKLIAHTGSIKKLAMYPASTIQIMGAEKALFRHFKTGESPPKHGLIYQHPEIRASKWWVRGKIARLLGLKISLAIKKDYFGEGVVEVDTGLKEEVLRKIEEIKKDNPFPKRPSRSKSKSNNSSKNSKKTKKFEAKQNRKNKKSKKYNKKSSKYSEKW
ncbi:MAG: NOP5/NOP56 family protein, partial [Methanobacteriaceae archaeon]